MHVPTSKTTTMGSGLGTFILMGIYMAAALLGIPQEQLDAALDMVMTGAGLFGISAFAGVVNAVNKRKAKASVAIIKPSADVIASELIKHMPEDNVAALKKYFMDKTT